MRAVLLLPVVVAGALATTPARALAWPDVTARIESDLVATDPATRVTAVEHLEQAGASRLPPLVLRAMTDPEPAVRIAAADVAARARVAGATVASLPWLAEHDARLRLRACALARVMPDPRAVAPLSRALSDPDGIVRANAAEALGFQASPEAVPPLLGKLDDPSWGVRVDLAQALARLHDPRAVLPLIGKVEDPVPEVRQAVARALAELGDPRASAALALQLRDASADVRTVALGALGQLGAADAVDAITPLVTDRSASVRRVALATLGVLAHRGSTAALTVLLSRLGLDDDATLELEPTPLREALVAGGEVTVAPLRAVLRGGAGGKATSSAWVLGELGATAAAADVKAALRKGTLPAAAALRALATLGSAEDLQVVLEYVGDESTAIRREALRATRHLLSGSRPDGRAVEPLEAVLAGARRLEPGELVQVVELLGRTRAPRAARSLTTWLGAKDLATKLAALDALGALGPAGADSALLPLVSDPVPEVRLRAAQALAESGAAEAREGLLKVLTSGSELDRGAALTALAGVLARAPSDKATHQVKELLGQAVGAERDAVLVVLGRSSPMHLLAELATTLTEADDRRTLASSVAGRADAAAFLLGLLRDPDAGVRAEAAWSLGSVAGPGDGLTLRRAAAPGPASRAEVAGNATAALGRLLARTHGDPAAAGLCELLADARPVVRANALAGLALASARCADGASERRLLVDPYELVRTAAARALRATPLPADDQALKACSVSEPSATVAALCTGHPKRPEGAPRSTVVYVEPPRGRTPRPHASYLVELGDGLLRSGLADRRGAFVDPVAPDGELRLVAQPELSPPAYSPRK